jgi:hypothetical protein
VRDGEEACTTNEHHSAHVLNSSELVDSVAADAHCSVAAQRPLKVVRIPAIDEKTVVIQHGTSCINAQAKRALAHGSDDSDSESKGGRCGDHQEADVVAGSESLLQEVLGLRGA